MSEKEKELDNKIKELEQLKLKLMLEEGRAYRCRECDVIHLKSKDSSESEKEGLCFTCWCKKVREEKREKLLQFFKEARIIDIDPRDNPYSDICQVDRIVLEVDGIRYEVVPSGYDPIYIEIRSEE
jgi:hypothetical protein